MTIDTGNTAYDPNSLDGGYPKEVPVENGGFATYAQRIDGIARRVRSASFDDHFSQATLFWNSMTAPEKEHIVSAFSFELTKVTRPEIRERVLTNMLANIDGELAARVAANLGMKGASSNGTTQGRKNRKNGKAAQSSPALSLMQPGAEPFVKGRKVAILVGPGAERKTVGALQTTLANAGVASIILSDRIGVLDGTGIEATQTLATMPSVAFDAVAAAATPDGAAQPGDMIHYVNEAYKHGKPIAFTSDDIVEAFDFDADSDGSGGIVISEDAAELGSLLIAALGKHRFFEREIEAVPA
jgi:catalase